MMLRTIAVSREEPFSPCLTDSIAHDILKYWMSLTFDEGRQLDDKNTILQQNNTPKATATSDFLHAIGHG